MKKFYTSSILAKLLAHNPKTRLSFFFLMLFALQSIIAQVSFSAMDVPVTENFNQTSLNVSSFSLADNTSIPGVYVRRTVGNAVPNIITRTAGGVNSGNLYHFGLSSTDADRALGGIFQSTTGVLNYGIRYKNNTGGIITSLVVTYVGEQWRTGTGNVVNTLSFDYRQAPTLTDLTTGPFTAVSALNFTSPIISSTGTALDGHAPANSKTMTATIVVTIPIGEEILLRWTDVDDSGLDCAMSIDDISVTPKAATSYFYSGTGSLANVANWGTNSNGSGSNPLNFTSDFQLFQICNTTAVTTDVNWTVSGTGSKVVLGNLTSPIPPITLTLAAGTSIITPTAAFDVLLPSSGNHTIIYQNITPVSLGVINDPNLALVYDGTTITTSTSRSYGNVSLINNATVNMSGASIVVKNLTIDVGSVLLGAYTSSNYIAIRAGGGAIINGTFKTGRLNGFVTSFVAIPVITSTSYNSILFEGSENLSLGGSSTIEYYRGTSGNTGTQIIEARAYNNLILSNSGVSNNKTFASGAISIAGNFTINTFNGSETVTLTGEITTNSLNLLSGKVILGANNLKANTISGGSNNAYVVTNGAGTLTCNNFTGAVIFPVGPSSNAYTPATITNNATARDFSAKVETTVLNPLDASKIVNLQWNITPSILTGNNADLTLQWNTSNQAINFSSAKSTFIGRYNYTLSTWDDFKLASVAGASPYTASVIGFTEFTPFSVSNVSELLKLNAKVLLSDMSGFPSTDPSFPLTDPYSVVNAYGGAFTHVDNAVVATTTVTVLNTNTIQEWVFLELRNGVSGSTSVVQTRAALLKTNGDIVATDGVSPVTFSAAVGNYYIAVRHRNSLGFRTNATYPLSNTPTVLDFTNNTIALNGSTPLILQGGVWNMISGDANTDGSVDAFDTIVWETQNGLFNSPYTLNADYNLDGSVDAFDSIIWELNNGKYQELD